MGRSTRVLAAAVLTWAHAGAVGATCFVQTPVGFGDDFARDVAIQSDGKIVAVGETFNGTDRDFSVVRYNADLSLDLTFGTGGIVTTDFGLGDDHALAVTIQPDGKIVVVGSSFNGADLDFAAVRYDPGGSVDPTFNGGSLFRFSPGADDVANDVTLQSDGKIVIAGHAFLADDDFAVVRLNPDGTFDPSFDFDGLATTSIGTLWDLGESVVVQPDGKIVVGGYVRIGGVAGHYDFGLVRYNANGSLDTSFDTDGKVTTSLGPGDERGNALLLQPDGKLVLAGATFNGTDLDFAVVRYNVDGSLDPSFDADGVVTTPVGSGQDWAADAVLQPNGKIVVAGHAFNGTDQDVAIVRYHANGTLDASFDSDGIATAPLLAGDDHHRGIALQTDGKIVTVGGTHNGTNSDHALVRYDADGSFACGRVSLHPTADGSVNAFSVTAACPGPNFACVNDQPGDAGMGPVVTNDGLGSYIEDGNGQNNREMFALDDGTIPSDAIVTALEIHAQVGWGGGPGPNVSLSYQRIGWDGAPVDGPTFGVGVPCCANALAWPVGGLNWTAAELDALEIGLFHVGGGAIQASQLSVNVTYLLPPPTRVNYRSIGTRANYGTTEPEGSGTTVAATTGSSVVSGSGATWQFANRGRGDRIDIDGVDYTILSVDSQSVLTLTSPYTGLSGAGKSYSISRQYTTLQAWEDCISLGGPCSVFPVASSSLVADDREEVGIAYNDTVFTPAGGLTFDGSTTDVDHGITLTVDPGNRHDGVVGAGVLIDGLDARNWIDVHDSNVTVEWLELVRIRGGAAAASIRLWGTGAPTNVLLQNLLIHDFHDASFTVSGIRLSGSGGKSATIRNVMIWDGDEYGIEGDDPTDTLAIENVSIDGIAGTGIESGFGTVTVFNTIVTSSAVIDFGGTFDGASSHNTASDGSAPGANADSATAASLFVTPGVDLHLLTAPNPAIDTGLDRSGNFTDDIDGDVRSGAWDRGADEHIAYVPFRIHYRSIGVTTGALASGTASIPAGGSVVTFGASLPPLVGQGDELLIGAETFYILSVDSGTQVTVQSPATVSHAGDAYTVHRAFNTLQSWEDAREGDLVTDNRREIGVAYNDGPFLAGVEFEDSTTDPSRYLKLTVAPIARHTGVAGSGVLVDCMNADTGIVVRNDHTVVEWLEVRRARGSAGTAAVRVREARSVLLSNLVLQDNNKGARTSGNGGADFTLRNSFIFNNDDDGVEGDELTDAITLENCTLYGNGDVGVDESGGSPFTVTNTLSLANGGEDFKIPSGTQSHNISSDGTAAGPGSLTLRSPTDVASPGPGNWIIFSSIVPGAEDLHLQNSVDNQAIDGASDLSPTFWDDIDGASRTAAWDVGADEAGLPNFAAQLVSDWNQSFVVGSAPVIAATLNVQETPAGGNVTAANDIRIRIPAGFNMAWDTSITMVTLGGAASGRVDTNVTYEDGAKTVVLDVTSDFFFSENLIVDDLRFMSFTAPSSTDHLELETGNDGVVSDLDDQTIVSVADTNPTISSDSDQVFTDSAPPTLAAPVSVSDAETPVIAPGNDIHIVIPAALDMTWDSGILTPVFGGPAAAKVDPNVAYVNGDKTLVVTVTAPFAVGDYIVLSDVYFANFVGPTSGSLELEIGVPQDTDDKVIAIRVSEPVDVITATSTSANNHLEWVNPNDPGYVHTRILARDDGVFPSGPFDVNARFVADHPGTAGLKASIDDGSLVNGQTYHYTAFVYDGSEYSAGVTTTGRPFDNGSGDVRWAYSTGYTALVPPALRFESPTVTYVYAVSNDSRVHAMNGSGSASPGKWPTNWYPFTLGGPAQSRVPVLPFAIGGASQGAVLLGSEDGTVYAIDADTGEKEWQSTVLGDRLLASPAGIFTNYGAPFSFLVIGTRNSATANVFHGLDPTDGDVEWTFDNSSAQSGDDLDIGVISGTGSVQYQDPGDGSRYFYFTSRSSTSVNTVWCVKWDDGLSAVDLVWASDLPGVSGSRNVDGSPVLSTLYGGRVYVGTTGGEVVALDAATGTVKWIFNAMDGPIKKLVFPQYGSTNLFFSTTNKVWSLRDDDTSATPNTNWPASFIPTPSTPAFVVTTTHVLVGSGDGHLYQLDVTDPAIFEREKLGDGAARIGMPTIDLRNDVIYVGSESGIVYAVDYPLLP